VHFKQFAVMAKAFVGAPHSITFYYSYIKVIKNTVYAHFPIHAASPTSRPTVPFF